MDEEEAGSLGPKPKAYKVFANHFLDDTRVFKMSLFGIERF